MPKFIRIETVRGIVYFINVNKVESITMTDYSIDFIFNYGSQQFIGDDYPTAKAAWIEVWKVTP